MKYIVKFEDCWNHKIHTEECESLQVLQNYMWRYAQSDCVCISLEVL